MQGQDFKDVAVSALRGEEAAGHLGLWPEAALINTLDPNPNPYPYPQSNMYPKPLP